MKPKQLSSNERAELTRQAGSDGVLAYMLDNGLPLTRERYLEINYGAVPDEPLDPEAEMAIPEMFRSVDD